jgi:hypothetical protein
MGANWPLYVCLFLSALIFSTAWTVWKRRHRIVAEKLTWAATAVGMLIVLGWAAVIRPDLIGFFLLVFGIGGAPACLLGMWAVIDYMIEAAHHE